MSDHEQLLHLVDRARRGAALPAELDALAAGITAQAARIATLEHVAAGNRKHVPTIVPELEQAEARIAELEQQLADADGELAEVREHNDATCEAVARAERAEAAINHVLSPAGIRAAAEAIGDEALTLLGRDLGTIHVERIAEAGLRAALDEQQPTT